MERAYKRLKQCEVKILKGNVSGTKLSLPLANKRRLFERDEDRSHSRDVLRLFVGFRIEVAETGYSLPFRPWAAVIGLCQESLL